MGAVVGFVLGYVMGAKSGDQGFAELEESWRTITSSGEMKDMVTGGIALLRDLLRQSGGLLAGRLQGESEQGLRRAA